jgi:integrase
MASAGVSRRVSKRTGRVSYDVWWRLDDGSQGKKTFAKKTDATEFKNDLLANARSSAARHGRLRFDDWADRWWAVWSTRPGLSPNTLQMSDSRLRRYLRPTFGPRLVRAIAVQDVKQWQHSLEAKVGHDTVMACRSLLYRILQAAEYEGIIAANPVPKVAAPRPPVDPDAVFGKVKRRTLTPEEAGQLLAGFPRFWWDHVITLLGTGLRISELTGLPCLRVVDLDDPERARVEVAQVRYEAGKYGSGIKNRPKSIASIREVPLPHQVAAAIARQLPPDRDPAALVFSGPGAPRTGGGRTIVSRHNFHRLYRQAIARASDPAAILPPSGKRALRALCEYGPQTVEDLAERLAGSGRRLRPRTLTAALTRAEADGLVTSLAVEDGSTRWAVAQRQPFTRLASLDLRGPHGLRHTYATWLEEAGIPVRVIDELMGHRAGSRAGQGSTIGRRYRHTTPEMRARVISAIETRLAITLQIAEKVAPERPRSSR